MTTNSLKIPEVVALVRRVYEIGSNARSLILTIIAGSCSNPHCYYARAEQGTESWIVKIFRSNSPETRQDLKTFFELAPQLFELVVRVASEGLRSDSAEALSVASTIASLRELRQPVIDGFCNLFEVRPSLLTFFVM